MPGSTLPARSFNPLPEEPRPGYVTQAQLEESAQRISQSFQQQFAAFTNELLSRIPPQQPSSSFFPPSPSEGQPLSVPPALLGCAAQAGQQGDNAEYMSPLPRQQTRFAARPQQHQQCVKAMGESPSFAHDGQERIAGGHVALDILMPL